MVTWFVVGICPIHKENPGMTYQKSYRDRPPRRGRHLTIPGFSLHAVPPYRLPLRDSRTST